MCPMDFCGCVTSFQAFDDDRTVTVMRSNNNVYAPSRIQRLRLNDGDSSPRDLSQPLIEDEKIIEWPRPISTLFILSLFDGKCILGCLE